MLDRGPFQCVRQCLLCPPLASLTNRCLSLPKADRVVRCPELHLAPEYCDKVSFDDTGRLSVLRGRLGWFRKGQSRLFDWQAGDPSHRYAVAQSLKQRRHKGLPQRFLHWSKGVANSWGHLLQELPLLLE